MDSRLAAFLLEQSDLEETDRLRITQEQIAGNLGTAREVVTRMLGYLRSEGLAEPERGGVRLLDRRGLEALAGFGRKKSV
jgi:CRP/FNR family transcriptional regulator